jgi:ribosomal protein S18 acetylase RimI-like enzyme
MPDLSVEHVEKFGPGVLVELCAATVDAITDGIGFGWVRPPSRQRLEAYWRGVVLVPERELFIGLVDGSVAGSVQLVKPSPNFEAVRFNSDIETHFVAPWARGHGLARQLLEAAERAAIGGGFSVMRLDVRASQDRAISLYESCGYARWGTLDRYHKVNDEMIAGHFYVKTLT